MHRLSLISLAALVAVGGILAFTVFVHPAFLASPAAPQAGGQSNVPSSTAGSNSTLLTQPPAQQTGGDDGGGSFDS